VLVDRMQGAVGLLVCRQAEFVSHNKRFVAFVPSVRINPPHAVHPLVILAVDELTVPIPERRHARCHR
jgi:hypothetical protein